MNILEKLTEYNLSFQYDSLSAKEIQAAENSIFDCMACILSGCEQDPVKTVKKYSLEYGGVPVSTAIGLQTVKTDPCHAAMINTMAAHVLDFDEISPVLHGHPSVVMLPTVLAVAEKYGASGKEAIAAYAAGIETACALSKLAYDGGYFGGWDSSGVFGAVGAAAVAGRLMKLKKDQMVYALAIAVSEGTGFRANYGTAAKDLTAGRASAKGIYAAEMARRGFNACREILEDSKGFLAAVGITTNPGFFLNAAKLGEYTLVSPGLIQKPYPTCRGTHNAIDAVLQLKRQGLLAKQIEKIVCRAQKSALENDRYPTPENVTQAKFSLPYCMALALTKGGISTMDFTPGALLYPEAMELMKKIEMIEDDSLFLDAKCGVNLEIITKSGKSFCLQVNYAKGAPQNPLSEKEMLKKFNLCAAAIGKEKQTSEIIRIIKNLKSYTTIKTFLQDLQNLLENG